MQGEESQTVILYRQGEQDYITFGNNEPLQVKVVDGLPIELVIKVENEALAETIPITGTSGHLPNDSIQYAAQVGRLDVVSALLGFLAVFIAIVAFFGFYQVSRSVRAIAREETGNFASDQAAKIITDYVEKNGETLVTKQTSSLLNSREGEHLIAKILNRNEMTALIAAQIRVTDMDKTGEVMAAGEFDVSSTTVSNDLSGRQPTKPGQWDDQDG